MTDPLRAPLPSKRGAGERSGTPFTYKQPQELVESRVRGDNIGSAPKTGHFTDNRFLILNKNIQYTLTNIRKTGQNLLSPERKCFYFCFYLFDIIFFLFTLKIDDFI